MTAVRGDAGFQGATSPPTDLIRSASPRTADGRWQSTGLISAREAQVLVLATQGNTYLEIGRLLSIDHSTVKDHVKSLRRKLGARSMVQAVDIAWRRGLLEAEA